MTLRILSWHPISVSRVVIRAQVSKAVIADHLCTTLPTERARWYITAFPVRFSRIEVLVRQQRLDGPALRFNAVTPD